MSRSGSIGLVMPMTSAVAAHHSPNMYDQQTNVSAAGTVTRYAWTNPHVCVYIEARADTGELVERFELTPIACELDNAHIFVGD